MKQRKEQAIGITVFLPASMLEALDNYMPLVSRNKAVVHILEQDKTLMKKVKELNNG